MRLLNTPWARAAAIALAMATTVTAAPPAMAQLFPNFGSGEFYDGPTRLCLMTNAGIRRAIQRQGYSDVYLNVPNDRRIQARATKGKWVYILDVNACSGRVLDRKRLRAS